MLRFIFKSLISLLILTTMTVDAGVVVSGTRVIYREDESEVTVKVTNKGRSPVLIQAWIDNGNQNIEPSKIKTPFMVTPPMNRINADKGQTLRISHINYETLPSDRESLFWLNVLEIPSIAPGEINKNKIQVAFRTRIKLFYRPSGLKMNSARAAESLQWSLNQGELSVHNSSPYHINLLNVKTGDGQSDIALSMLKPFEKVTVSVINKRLDHGMQIHYRYINDYGSIKEVKTTI